MISLIAILSFLLVSCYYDNVPPNNEKKILTVYVSSKNALRTFDFDGETLEPLGEATGNFSGAPVVDGDEIIVPDESGYTIFSTDLEISTPVEIGFEVKKVLTYDDEEIPVGATSLKAFGKTFDFESISDACIGPDGIYVASGKDVYRITEEGSEVVVESSSDIISIAVDEAGKVYYGTEEGISEFGINGKIVQMEYVEGELYVLTEDHIYEVDPLTSDKKGCSTNFSGFHVHKGLVFFVYDFGKTFGVFDMNGCKVIDFNNLEEKPIGINVWGE